MHILKTTQSISSDKIKRKWHLIDMKGKILGRELSRVSVLLQGKHKTEYSPHLDCGDFVVVINTSQVVLTGKKGQMKEYDRFSGYPGGLKKVNAGTLIKKNPSRLVISGVGGMLPKNKLRERRLARLFVFPDATHPYQKECEVNKP